MTCHGRGNVPLPKARGHGGGALCVALLKGHREREVVPSNVAYGRLEIHTDEGWF